ncbi:MAG TPA: VOC family protein [Acetobacteraceae bacterium]|nr:VOC family protein [Acetobacteraceae bacterium]
MSRPDRGCRFLQHVFLAALLLGFAAVPVSAARLRLPPIVEPASQEQHVGKVIFVELVTPDLALAERFYGGLFGWTFRDMNAGGTAYAEAMLAGSPVAGLFQRKLPAREHRQPAWLTYFSVRDVDAAAETAVQDGGKVLFSPHSFPDRGREAVLADPQGAVFAVLASSSGDPPDVLADPGAWIWSSLITSDPNGAAAFYQKLFGYDVFPLPPDGSMQHLILASGGYARASVNSLPPGRPNVRPHWLNYVRVDDAGATAARAAALGGRVLIAPRMDRDGGKIALIADPLGAVFGLLERPAKESGEVSK